MSDLVGNPEDPFSQNEAHILILISKSRHLNALLASEVVQPGLCLTWSEIHKTGFLRARLIVSSADTEELP